MKTDLIERLNARARNTPSDVSHLLSQAADRIAALEAEASEGERLRAALVEAREALDQSYNVTTYPGDGTSKQDAAIRAIDAALIPAPAREGWQPISSAPTNRAIQIHVPSLDYYGNGGVFAGMLVDMGTGRRWMTFGWAIGRDLGPESTPTHWRPLPPPPPQDREPDSQRGAK